MSPQILFNQPLNSLSPLPPSDFTLLFTSLTRGVAAIVLRGGREPSPTSPSHFFGDKEEDKSTGSSVSGLENNTKVASRLLENDLRLFLENCSTVHNIFKIFQGRMPADPHPAFYDTLQSLLPGILPTSKSIPTQLQLLLWKIIMLYILNESWELQSKI